MSEEFESRTYKIKATHDDPPLFLTMTNVTEGGVTRPHDIFINSKDVDSYQWVQALTGMAAMVFKHGVDPQKVADTLKEVFDPNGGYFAERQHQKSMVSHIGNVIQRHIDETCKVINLESIDLDSALEASQELAVDRDITPSIKQQTR